MNSIPDRNVKTDHHARGIMQHPIPHPGGASDPMRGMTSRRISGIVVLMVSVACSLSAQVDESAPGSRSYYIDPTNGNDGSNGGTYARPWKSFRNLSTYDGSSRPAQKAYLAAGDCVYVMGGTISDVNYVYGDAGIGAIAYFRADWDGCRGTTDKRIRLKAYPGTNPVLDAQYRGYGIMLDGCDYWDVSGLTIRNAIPIQKMGDGRLTVPEGGAIYVVGGRSLKIHGMSIFDTAGVPGQNNASFVGKSILDFEFYNNRMRDAKELLYSDGKIVRDGGDVYLYATDGPSKNGTLARVFHSDESGTGDHVYHHNDFQFSTSVASEGDGLGFKHGNRDLTKSVELHGNIFRNCRRWGILVSTPNVSCHHNVVVGCGIGLASSSLGGGPGGGTFLVNQSFQNNTIYDTKPNSDDDDASSGYWFGNQEEVSPLNPALEPQDIVFRKNIIVDLRSGIADLVTINSYLSDVQYQVLRGEFSLSGNCYYAPNGTARFGIAGSNSFGSMGSFYTDFSLWQSVLGYDADSMLGQNPIFFGASDGNFHLSAATPCPDAGAFPRDVTDTAPPAIPRGIAVYAHGLTALSIRWDEPTSWADVAGYRVFRNGTLILDTVATGMLDANLGGRTDHAYAVRAYDRAGNVSELSASATLSGGTDLPNAAPVVSAASATPSPVTGTTSSLSASASDDAGEAGLAYTWSATGPAAVAFAPNGTNAAKSSTATFSRAGAYVLTVSARDAGGLSATRTVNLTVSATPTAVAVSPASATVSTGGTAGFAAVVSDQFGRALASQPAATWTVSGGGTISSGGVFTAGATAGGPHTVTATAGGRSGTAQVTVTTVPNQAPVAAAQSVNVVAGTATAITLSGSDADGDALTCAIVSEPAHGTLSGGSTLWIYTPAVGYTGFDSFTFTVHDGDVGSSPAMVSIQVSGGGDSGSSGGSPGGSAGGGCGLGGVACLLLACAWLLRLRGCYMAA